MNDMKLPVLFFLLSGLVGYLGGRLANHAARKPVKFPRR